VIFAGKIKSIQSSPLCRKAIFDCIY